MNCLPGYLLAGGDGHRYFIRKNAVKIEENSRHIVIENKTGLLFTLIEYCQFWNDHYQSKLIPVISQPFGISMCISIMNQHKSFGAFHG